MRSFFDLNFSSMKNHSIELKEEMNKKNSEHEFALAIFRDLNKSLVCLETRFYNFYPQEDPFNSSNKLKKKKCDTMDTHFNDSKNSHGGIFLLKKIIYLFLENLSVFFGKENYDLKETMNSLKDIRERLEKEEFNEWKSSILDFLDRCEDDFITEEDKKSIQILLNEQKLFEEITDLLLPIYNIDCISEKQNKIKKINAYTLTTLLVVSSVLFFFKFSFKVFLIPCVGNLFLFFCFLLYKNYIKIQFNDSMKKVLVIKNNINLLEKINNYYIENKN